MYSSLGGGDNSELVRGDEGVVVCALRIDEWWMVCWNEVNDGSLAPNWGQMGWRCGHVDDTVTWRVKTDSYSVQS